MKTCVALLRGINVGGKNSLPMKTLITLLGNIGARNVKTYIQSGNVVFQSAESDLSRFSKALPGAIKKHCGFEPSVLIFGVRVLEMAMENNPFPEAEADPSSLHLGFLASIPKNLDLDKLDRLRKDSERFRLIGSVFYLHAPNGIGRSKLAANSEKLLGVPMTDLNWRTVCTILELANEKA